MCNEKMNKTYFIFLLSLLILIIRKKERGLMDLYKPFAPQLNLTLLFILET